MLNARWLAAVITLTDAWTRPPKRRAILILDIKALVDHDPNWASRRTWRTSRTNGVRSLAVACLKCRRATNRQRSWCPVVPPPEIDCAPQYARQEFGTRHRLCFCSASALGAIRAIGLFQPRDFGVFETAEILSGRSI